MISGGPQSQVGGQPGLRRPRRRYQRAAAVFSGLIVGNTGYGAEASDRAFSREWIAPRIEEVAFHSEALGREMKAVVVHPREDGSTQPVLFLLHGRGRNRRSLVDLPDVRHQFLAADCWVVLPDGDDGWYIDSPANPADRYNAYLEEVITRLTTLFRLNPDTARRAIAGWSMGGYGAVRFAETHPKQFGVVVSILGLLDFPRDETLPPHRNYPVPVARFGSDAATWRRFNPLYGVGQLRGKSLQVITASDAFDSVMNQNFSAALDAVGIEHEFRRLPGSHTLDVVRAALPGVLEFVARKTSGAGSK